jgi:hypothetical protein
VYHTDKGYYRNLSCARNSSYVVFHKIISMHDQGYKKKPEKNNKTVDIKCSAHDAFLE